MSGFEVVGIVLGALPLLMSAVEAYGHYIRGWRTAAPELKSLNRQLSTEKAKLYNVCSLLIKDVVPLQDFEPMLTDPFGPMWKSKHTDAMVRRRLWQSYNSFVDAVQEVSEALDKIRKRLEVHISRDGQVKWLEQGQMTRQFKKFLFQFNRAEFQDELAAISKSIGDMCTLVQQGVSLEPSRKKQSRGKLYKILRDLATSIHQALCSNMCCSDHHDVGLEMATRIIEVGYGGDDEDVRCSTNFKMAISFEMAVKEAIANPANGAGGNSGQSSVIKRFWDELNIQATTQTLQPLKKTNPWQPQKLQTKATGSFKKVTLGMSHTLSFTGVGPSKRPPMPGTKSAIALVTRLVTNIAFIETATTTTMTAIASATGTKGASPSQTGPFNLCLALKKACGAAKRPKCYGHLVDQECGAKRYFQVCPLGTSSYSSDSWSIVTLEDVLQHKKGLPPLISLAEKVQLALAMASNVLQLSKTPWLPEGLTNKNVYFFRRNDAPLSYDHAFLLTSLPRQGSINNNDTNNGDRISTYVSTSSLSINPTMFSLGILLLEIILGKSFEKLRVVYDKYAADFDDDDDDDSSEILGDLDIAQKLLEERVMRINPEYAAVVQRCINCNRCSGLDNNGFRQDVYNDVLMPLECLVDSTKLGGCNRC